MNSALMLVALAKALLPVKLTLAAEASEDVVLASPIVAAWDSPTAMPPARLASSPDASSAPPDMDSEPVFATEIKVAPAVPETADAWPLKLVEPVATTCASRPHASARHNKPAARLAARGR